MRWVAHADRESAPPFGGVASPLIRCRLTAPHPCGANTLRGLSTRPYSRRPCCLTAVRPAGSHIRGWLIALTAPQAARPFGGRRALSVPNISSWSPPTLSGWATGLVAISWLKVSRVRLRQGFRLRPGGATPRQDAETGQARWIFEAGNGGGVNFFTM